MLVALDSNGQLVNLAQKQSQEQLDLLRKSSYYCPQCRCPVIFKAGAIKIPHFAHKHTSTCFSFSERESERHLKGKADLYAWISHNSIAQLEPFLSSLSQRPDILAANKIAIEFQCSPLSTHLFIERTNGYLENDYLPFWIYGGPPIKRQGGYFKLTAFHRLFIQYSPDFGFWLLAYCPEKEICTFYSRLTPLSSSLYTASVQNIPLSRLSFPPLFSKPSSNLTFSLAHWLKQKHQWIHKQLYFQQGRYHPFLSDVYESGNNPFLLSEWVGIPIRYMALFKSHPLEWQFYLWKEGLLHKIEEAVACLEKYVEKGRLQLNVFPLLQSPNLHQLVEEYLSLIQMASPESLQSSSHTYKQMEREKRFSEQYEELIINRLFL
ncbi:competence protein CoiA family protein [Bacillus sp. REN10]|uniref:competence protein CoiA n=1 Tax=Bacillus sp. REN10 TaxID=2782541 RepID=UPI00193B4602|nr:competence protein CoiA family protein [Bacillus sp. REN10]